MTEYCGDYGGTNNRGEPCDNEAGWGTDFSEGKCRFHRGTSPDGSSHEGNDFAVKHGAWSDSFVQDFLREDEIERVRKAEDLLGEPESAQDVGRTAAAVALEQFRRSADDRFLNRFKQICEAFSLAPESVDRLEVDADVEHSGSLDLEGATVTYAAQDTDEDE